MRARIFNGEVINYTDVEPAEGDLMTPNARNTKPYIVPVIKTNEQFNRSTQVREGPVVTVFADRVEWVYTVRAMTVEEVAARDAELQKPINLATLRSQAETALESNRTFLALASPSNAQTLAQVKSLTRQMNAVIRLVVGKLDGTD